MKELQALALFMFVAAVTPGPNNALLSACGLQFGFARAVPHVVGTTIGMGALALAGEVGVGAAVAAVPGLEFGLRLAGSAYLFWIALRLARFATLDTGRVVRPLRTLEAAAFQFVNPKSILFSVAAVATFRPTGLPATVGGVLVVATIMIVVLIASTLWAAGGTALARLARDEKTLRAVNLALAAVLAASIALIWL
jgi:threonine/homoserine/homoserine lactone efflux protein